MVFNSSVQRTETIPPPPQQQQPLSMDSPMSVKSEQEQQQSPSLDNFALPDLKLAAKSNAEASHLGKVSDVDQNHQSPPRNDAGSDPGKTEKSEKEKLASDAASDGGKSKFVIRLRPKNSKVDDAADHVGVGEEAEEFELKTWNLRPRKDMTKPKVNNNNNNASGGTLKIGGAAAQESKGPKGPKAKVKAPAATYEKPKFSISLTKEEIEADFIAMTGSKPPKKPQRRAKSAQKQLDQAFPGLWLSSIKPDSYKVNDDSPKL